MHRYGQIEYKAGATLEIIKCIPRKYRKENRGIRQPIIKKTKDEIQRANMLQAARKLARKINANFKPGDWHLTLTYRKEERPDRKTAQKYIAKFIADMRKEYSRHGYQFKYIQVTEYKNKAIHHHIVLNHVNDGKKTTTDYIRRFWKGRGSPKWVSLYDNGEYRVLAEYLVKETEKTFRDGDSPVKQRYSCSRNLVEPKPERRMKKTKRGWKQEPKARIGYYIDRDTLYNGFDKMGYPYQRYIMIKIKPEDSDWEPGSWPTREGGDDYV